MTVSTHNQVNTVGTGSQFHVGFIAVMRQGQDALDTLGFELIDVLLNSGDRVRERDRRASIRDIARSLQNMSQIQQQH